MAELEQLNRIEQKLDRIINLLEQKDEPFEPLDIAELGPEAVKAAEGWKQVSEKK